MPPLRLGLIGCGAIAQMVHLPLLLSFRDVALVAIAETNPERRDQACRRVPAALFFDDYLALLQTINLDGVVICLPTALHAQAAIAALEHGKHVYLEKPLALNLEQGRAVLEAWRHAKVIGAIGFNYRFNSLYESAKRAIRSGRLGTVLTVHTVFSTHSQDLSGWRSSRALGGGALYELGSHHIDLVRHLFDEEITQVFAHTRSVRSEDDDVTIEMQLESGAMAQAYFSLNGAEEDSITVRGENGTLRVDRYTSLEPVITDSTIALARAIGFWRGARSVLHTPYILKKLGSPLHEPSFRTALARFVSAARTNESVYPNLMDGYRSLEIVIAAEQSSRTEQAVVVEHLPET